MKKLPIPEGALHQHIAILGKTGAGKSSAARLIVEALLGADKPVCIVDPKGDWWGLKSSADGKEAGFPVVIFGGEHADVPINAHSGAHIAELVATGNRPCIIDLGGWMVSDRTRFFIDFASQLFRHARGMRWLVIDEVHNFAPQGKVLDPQAGQMLHWANRLASEGRGKGLQIIAASQRPQKVHKDFLTSCETLIAMRVIHPLDRGATKDWIDGCPDAAKGKEVLGSLASMPRGTGWVWSPEIGFGPEQIAFPKFRTYDSFKPSSGEHSKLKGWAEVNLEDVKAKLADVVKEAQANDPKLLRARIAKLEQERAVERKNPLKVLAIDHGAVRDAEQRGYTRGRAEGAKALKDAAHSISGINSALVKAMQKGTTELGVVEMQLYVAADAIPPAPAKSSFLPIEQRARRIPQRPVESRQARRASGDDIRLTTPQQRILDALAWLASIRPTDPADRTQVALLADQSPKSSGYSNNLGALRTAGLIEYPSGGMIKLTDAGHASAQTPDAEPTTADLHRTLQDKLPAPQWRILEALIEKHPASVARDELANMADQSPASSGYSNNLGALRSMGFLNYPSTGMVVAQACLFIQ